jgi:thiamine-phosphate pyrophosphorylase
MHTLESLAIYKLMLVTNCGDAPFDAYLQFIKECADSGITSVQLREKTLAHKDIVNLGRGIKEILAPKKIPLIINLPYAHIAKLPLK